MLNLRELVTARDYPSEAIIAGQEGSATALVAVDAKGRVTDCKIVVSSGSPSLDVQTCRLFWTRARFKPAFDARGRPTAGTLIQRITWRLEGDRRPLEPWDETTELTFDGAGTMLACVTRRGGALSARPMTETECRERFRPLAETGAMLAGSVPGAVATFVFSERWSPGAVAPPEPLGSSSDKLLLRVHARLTIDALGQVLKCEAPASAGPAAGVTEVCKNVDVEFTPKPPVPGVPSVSVGTWSASSFLRQ